MFANKNQKKIFKTCVAVIVGIGCIAGVIQSQKSYLAKLDTAKDINTYKAEAEAELAQLNLLIKTPAFGFDNLTSDYAILRFVNYFGNEDARQQIGYGLTSKYLETIIAKDPMHTEAQFIVSPMITLKEGNPQKTVTLLEKSLTKLSPIINSEDRDKLYKPNFLWIYKAIDELLFLDDAKAARDSYLKAAEWSHILGDNTRAESTSQMAEYLDKDPDNKTVQVGAWFNVWNSAPDAETKNLAKQNIERLGGRLEITDDGRALAYPPKENNS